jgi:endonuclease/exonuclease/phosphatase family metal-dependent hydrolase
MESASSLPSSSMHRTELDDLHRSTLTSMYFHTMGRWVEYTPGTSLPPGRELPAAIHRLATFNILADSFPWFIRLAIASKERFTALLDHIERLNPTFLGLNEVTDNALLILLQSEFIQRNYFVSALHSSLHPEGAPSALRPHGCLLLSKLPPVACHLIPPAPGSPQRCHVSAVFDPTGTGAPFVVTSIHTVAYQLERNAVRRKQQLEDAAAYSRELLRAHCTPKASNAASDGRKPTTIEPIGFVIMGDLNLHCLNEDAIVPHLGMIDAWAETHFTPEGDQNPGFTFDPTTNSMIDRYIPGEVRRMRLDRILLSDGIRANLEGPCTIWADAPVHRKRNIYLSDHYGLFVDVSFTKTKTAEDGKDETQAGSPVSHLAAPLHHHPTALDQLRQNAQLEWEEYRASKKVLALKLVPHLTWLGLRAMGWK